MRNATRKLVAQLALPSTLIVVFPALAMQPSAMLETMRNFIGSRLVMVRNAATPLSALPAGMLDCIDKHCEHADITTLSVEMFGNQRGLMLPVDLSVEIAARANLSAEHDRLLVTGCYRGWLPGSIDLLAEAFSAMHFHVEVDVGVPRR